MNIIPVYVMHNLNLDDKFYEIMHKTTISLLLMVPVFKFTMLLAPVVDMYIVFDSHMFNNPVDLG
jgi:hypothetical protein